MCVLFRLSFFLSLKYSLHLELGGGCYSRQFNYAALRYISENSFVAFFFSILFLFLNPIAVSLALSDYWRGFNEIILNCEDFAPETVTSRLPIKSENCF